MVNYSNSFTHFLWLYRFGSKFPIKLLQGEKLHLNEENTVYLFIAKKKNITY